MQYHQQIFDATKNLVEAFILDEKATDMPPRVMTLAQQYEKLLKSRYSKNSKKDEVGDREEETANKEDEDSKKDESDKGDEEKTKETETAEEKKNVVTAEAKEEKGDGVEEAEDEASKLTKAENVEDFDEPEFTKE